MRPVFGSWRPAETRHKVGSARNFAARALSSGCCERGTHVVNTLQPAAAFFAARLSFRCLTVLSVNGPTSGAC
jgi:hypothetical protein